MKKQKLGLSRRVLRLGRISVALLLAIGISMPVFLNFFSKEAYDNSYLEEPTVVEAATPSDTVNAGSTTINLTSSDDIDAYKDQTINYTLLAGVVVDDIFMLYKYSYYWDPMPSQDVVALMFEFEGSNVDANVAETTYHLFKFYTRLNGTTQGVLHFEDISLGTWHTLTFNFLVKSNTLMHNKLHSPSPKEGSTKTVNAQNKMLISASDVAQSATGSPIGLTILAGSVSYPSAVDASAYTSNDIGLKYSSRISATTGTVSGVSSITVMARSDFYRPYSIEFLIQDSNGFRGLAYCYVEASLDNSEQVVTQGQVSRVEMRSFSTPSDINAGFTNSTYNNEMYASSDSILKTIRVHGNDTTSSESVVRTITKLADDAPSVQAIDPPLLNKPTYEAKATGASKFDVVLQRNEQAVWKSNTQQIWKCGYMYHSATSTSPNGEHYSSPTDCTAIPYGLPLSSTANDTELYGYKRCSVHPTYIFHPLNPRIGGAQYYSNNDQTIAHPYWPNDGSAEEVTCEEEDLKVINPEGTIETRYVCEHNFSTTKKGPLTHPRPFKGTCEYNNPVRPEYSFARANWNTVPFYFRANSAYDLAKFPVTQMNKTITFAASSPITITLSDVLDSVHPSYTEDFYEEIENIYAYDRGYISAALLNTGTKAKWKSAVKIAPLKKTQTDSPRYLILTVRRVEGNVSYRTLMSIDIVINTDLDGVNEEFLRETNSAPTKNMMAVDTFSGNRGDRFLITAKTGDGTSIATDIDEDDINFDKIREAQSLVVMADQITAVSNVNIRVYRGNLLAKDPDPNADFLLPMADPSSADYYNTITIVINGVFSDLSCYLRVEDENGNPALIPITISGKNKRPLYDATLKTYTSHTLAGARMTEDHPNYDEQVALQYDKLILTTKGVPESGAVEKTWYNYGYDNDNSDYYPESSDTRIRAYAKYRDYVSFTDIVYDDSIIRFNLLDEITYPNGTVGYQTIEIYAIKQGTDSPFRFRLYDGYDKSVEEQTIRFNVRNTAPVRRMETIDDFIRIDGVDIVVGDSKEYDMSKYTYDLDGDTVFVDSIVVLESYVDSNGTHTGLGNPNYLNGYVIASPNSTKFTLTANAKTLQDPNYAQVFPGGGHFALKVSFRDTESSPGENSFFIIHCRVRNTQPTLNTKTNAIKDTGTDGLAYHITDSGKDSREHSISAGAVVTDVDRAYLSFSRPGTESGAHYADEVYFTGVEVHTKWEPYAQVYFRTNDQKKSIMYKYDASIGRFHSDKFVTSISELFSSTGDRVMHEYYRKAYFSYLPENFSALNPDQTVGSHNLLGPVYFKALRSTQNVTLPLIKVHYADTAFTSVNLNPTGTFNVLFKIDNTGPTYRLNESGGQLGFSSASNPISIKLYKDTTKGPSAEGVPGLYISPYLLATDTDLQDSLYSPERSKNAESFLHYAIDETTSTWQLANFIVAPSDGAYSHFGAVEPDNPRLYRVTNSFLTKYCESNSSHIDQKNTTIVTIGGTRYNRSTAGIVNFAGTSTDSITGNEILRDVSYRRPLLKVDNQPPIVDGELNEEHDSLRIAGTPTVQFNDGPQYISVKITSNGSLIFISAVQRHLYNVNTQSDDYCQIRVPIVDRGGLQIDIWLRVTVVNSSPILSDELINTNAQKDEVNKNLSIKDVFQLTCVEGTTDAASGKPYPTQVELAPRDLAKDPDDDGGNNFIESLSFDEQSGIRVYLDYTQVNNPTSEEDGNNTDYITVGFQDLYYNDSKAFPANKFYARDTLLKHLVITAKKNTTLLPSANGQEPGYIYVGFRVKDNTPTTTARLDLSPWLFIRVRVVNSIPEQSDETSRMIRLNNVLDLDSAAPENGKGYFAMMVRPEDTRVRDLKAKMADNTLSLDVLPGKDLGELGDGTFDPNGKSFTTTPYNTPDAPNGKSTYFLPNYDGYDNATDSTINYTSGGYSNDNYFTRPLIVLNSDPDGDPIRLKGQTLRGGAGKRNFGASKDSSNPNIIGKEYETSSSTIYDVTLSQDKQPFYDIHFFTEEYSTDPSDTKKEILWYAIIIFKGVGTGSVTFEVVDDGAMSEEGAPKHTLRFSVSNTKIDRLATPKDAVGTELNGMKGKGSGVPIVGTQENPIRLQNNYEYVTESNYDRVNLGDYKYVGNETILNIHNMFQLSDTTGNPIDNPHPGANMVMASSVSNKGIVNDTILNEGVDYNNSFTYNPSNPGQYTRRTAATTRTSENAAGYVRSSVASVEFKASDSAFIQIVSGYKVGTEKNQDSFWPGDTSEAPANATIAALKEYVADANSGKIDSVKFTNKDYTHYRGVVIRGKQRTQKPVELIFYVYVNGGTGYYEYEELDTTPVSYQLIEIPLSVWVVVENSPIGYVMDSNDAGLVYGTSQDGITVVDTVAEINGIDKFEKQGYKAGEAYDASHRGNMTSGTLGKRYVTNKQKAVVKNNEWTSITGIGYNFDVTRSVTEAYITTISKNVKATASIPIKDNDAPNDTALISYASLDAYYTGSLVTSEINNYRGSNNPFDDGSIGGGQTGQKEVKDPKHKIDQYKNYYYNNLRYMNNRDNFGTVHKYTDFFDIITENPILDADKKVIGYGDSQTLIIKPKQTTAKLKYCDSSTCNHKVDENCKGAQILNDGYFPLYFVVYDNFQNTAKNNFDSDAILKGEGTGKLDGSDFDDSVSRAIVCVRVYISNSLPTPTKSEQIQTITYGSTTSNIYLSSLFSDADMKLVSGTSLFDVNIPDANGDTDPNLDTIGTINYLSNLGDKVFYDETGATGSYSGHLVLSEAKNYKYDYNAGLGMTEADYKSQFDDAGNQAITLRAIRPVEELEEFRIYPSDYEIPGKDTEVDYETAALEKETNNRNSRMFSFYVVVTDFQNKNLYNTAAQGTAITMGDIENGFALCAIKITVIIRNTAPQQTPDNQTIELWLRDNDVKDSFTFQTYQYTNQPVYDSTLKGARGALLVATDNEMTYYNANNTYFSNRYTNSAEQSDKDARPDVMVNDYSKPTSTGETEFHGELLRRNQLHFVAPHPFTSVKQYLDTTYGTYLTFNTSGGPSSTAAQKERDGIQTLGPNVITVTANSATPLAPNDYINVLLYVCDNDSELSTTTLTYRIKVTKEAPKVKSDLDTDTFGLFMPNANAQTESLEISQFIDGDSSDLYFVTRPVRSQNNGRPQTTYRNLGDLLVDKNYDLFMGESDFVIQNDQGFMVNASSNSYISLSTDGASLNITKLKSLNEKRATAPRFEIRFVLKDRAENGVVVSINVMLVNDEISAKTSEIIDLNLNPVSLNNGQTSVNLKDYITSNSSTREIEADDLNSQYDVRIYEGEREGTANEIWEDNVFVAGYTAFGTYTPYGFSSSVNSIAIPQSTGIEFIDGSKNSESIKNLKLISLKKVSGTLFITVVVRKQVWYIDLPSSLNATAASHAIGEPKIMTSSAVLIFKITVPNSAPTVYSNRLPRVDGSTGKSSLEVSPLLENKIPQFSIQQALCDSTNSSSLIQDLDEEEVFLDTSKGFDVGGERSGWEVMPYQSSFGGSQETYQREFQLYRDDFESALMLSVPQNITVGDIDQENLGRYIFFGAKHKIIREAVSVDPDAVSNPGFVTLYIKIYIRDKSATMDNFIIPITISNNAPTYNASTFSYHLSNDTFVEYQPNTATPYVTNIPITAWIKDADIGSSNERFTVTTADSTFAEKVLSEEGYEIKTSEANGGHVLAIIKATAGWATFTIEGKSAIRGAVAEDLVLTISDASGERAIGPTGSNTIRISFSVINSAPKAVANPEPFVILGSSVSQAPTNLVIFLNEKDHNEYYTNVANNPDYNPEDSSTVPAFKRIFDDENNYYINNEGVVTEHWDRDRGYYRALSDISLVGNEIPLVSTSNTGIIATKGFSVSALFDPTNNNKLRTGEQTLSIVIFDGDPFVNADSLSVTVQIKIKVVEDPTLMDTYDIKMFNKKSKVISKDEILDKNYTVGITLSSTGYKILPYEGDAGTANVENVLSISDDGKSIVANSIGFATVEATLIVDGYEYPFKVRFNVEVVANTPPKMKGDDFFVTMLMMQFANADMSGTGTYSMRIAEQFFDDEGDELKFVSVKSANKSIVDVVIDPENDQILIFTCKARGTVVIEVEVQDAYSTYTMKFNYVNEDMADVPFFSAVWTEFMAKPQTYLMYIGIALAVILILVVGSRISRRRRMLREEAEANMIRETALEDQYLQLQAANNSLQLGMQMDYNPMQIGQMQYDNSMMLGQAPSSPMFDQMQLGMSSDFMPGETPLQLGEGMGGDFYDDNMNGGF